MSDEESHTRVTRRGALKAAGVSALVGLPASRVTANDVQFENTTHYVHEGDVVSIDLSVSTTNSFVVNVGDADDYGYEVEITIDPGTANNLSLEMNTFYTADEGTGDVFDVSAGSIENVEVISDAAGMVLAPNDYPLSVRVDETETDQGLLTIDERATGDSTVWTAPSEESLSSLDDIEDAAEAGVVTESQTVAIEDWFVYLQDVSGVFGLFAEKDYDSVDEMGQDGYVDFTVETAGGERLTQEARDAISVIPIPDTEELLFVADTDDLWIGEHNQDVPLSDRVNESFTATFTVSEEFRELFAQDGDETVTARFEAVERELEFETTDGEIRVDADGTDTISGTTTVAPGTTLEIHLEGELFIEDIETNVESDRTFSATYDFSSETSGQEFFAEVRDQGFANDAHTPGWLGDAEAAESGPFEVTDLQPGSVTIDEGEQLDVQATVTNTGGEDTQDVRLLIEGDVVTGETLSLSADESETLVFEPLPELPEGEWEYAVATEDDQQQATVTVQAHDHTDDDVFFEVSDLQPGDVSVVEGDVIEVSATVTNTGHSPETQEIVFAVDTDTDPEITQLSLDEGESQRVTFEFDTSGHVGEWQYAIGSQNDHSTAFLAVEDEERRTGASFEVSDVQPQTDSIQSGDPVDIEVTIENTGDSEGTQTVYVGFGDEVQTDELTLAGGESTTEHYTFDSSGYDGDIDPVVETEDDVEWSATSVTVDETSDSETDDEVGEEAVDEDEDEPDDLDTETETEEEDDGLLSTPLMVGGAGILAAGAAAVYALTQRGEDDESAGGGPPQEGPAGVAPDARGYQEQQTRSGGPTQQRYDPRVNNQNAPPQDPSRGPQPGRQQEPNYDEWRPEPSSGGPQEGQSPPGQEAPREQPSDTNQPEGGPPPGERQQSEKTSPQGKVPRGQQPPDERPPRDQQRPEGQPRDRRPIDRRQSDGPRPSKDQRPSEGRPPRDPNQPKGQPRGPNQPERQPRGPESPPPDSRQEPRPPEENASRPPADEQHVDTPDEDESSTGRQNK